MIEVPAGEIELVDVQPDKSVLAKAATTKGSIAMSVDGDMLKPAIVLMIMMMDDASNERVNQR